MDQFKKNHIAYAELLNRCWEDPSYLEKFRKDPAAALEEFGIPTVPGARYHIVEPDKMQPSTQEDIYLPYTPEPESRVLSDEMLSTVSVGDMVYMNSNIAVNVNVAADTMTAVETSAFVYAWGVLFVI